MVLDDVLITLSPDLEPLRASLHRVVAGSGLHADSGGTRLDLTRPGSPPTVWLDIEVSADADPPDTWPPAPLQLAIDALLERVRRTGSSTPRRAGAPVVVVTRRDPDGGCLVLEHSATPG